MKTTVNFALISKFVFAVLKILNKIHLLNTSSKILQSPIHWITRKVILTRVILLLQVICSYKLIIEKSYYHSRITIKLTWKSSKIGDATFIGLDCPSGNVDDCNDGTVESAPPECKGALIFSEEESQCGSKCDLIPQFRNSKKWWTYFTRQAFEFKNLQFSLYTV